LEQNPAKDPIVRVEGGARQGRKQELLRPLAKENQNKGGELGGNPTLSAKLPKGSAIAPFRNFLRNGRFAGILL
jgi:hypothetical protein